MTVAEVVEQPEDRMKSDAASLVVGANRAWSQKRTASGIALAFGHAVVLLALSQPRPKRALLAQIELLQHIAAALDDDPVLEMVS
jgi:hypothetical protein